MSESPAKRPAAFLDRDGTINVEVDYLADPQAFELLPGAGRAIARLNRAGLVVVVVTNQSGIARGLLDEADLEAIHARMHADLAAEGARVDLVLACPWHPEATLERWRGDSDWRKPAPGMVLEAARRLDLDLARSWIVGDSARDLEAGERAGVRGVLVATGKGLEQHRQLLAAAREHLFAADLEAAVTLVLARGS